MPDERDRMPVVLDAAAVQRVTDGARGQHGLPDWLHNEIVDGLTTLMGLTLKFKPVDEPELQAVGWFLAVAEAGMEDPWRQAEDTPRIRRAFARLAKRDEWPRPGHLLAALPPCEARMREAQASADARSVHNLAARERALDDERARLALEAEQDAAWRAAHPLSRALSPGQRADRMRRLRREVFPESDNAVENRRLAIVNKIREQRGAPPFATVAEWEAWAQRHKGVEAAGETEVRP